MSDPGAPTQSFRYSNDIYDGNSDYNSSNPSFFGQSHAAVLDYLLHRHPEFIFWPASSPESTGAGHELIWPNIPNCLLTVLFRPVPSSIGSGEDAGNQWEHQDHWLCMVCLHCVRTEDRVSHLEPFHSKEWRCRW